MRAADRTEYIVQALVEGGAMYEDGAKSFLAEHDASRRAEVLKEAADAIDAGSPGSECDCCTGAANLLRRMATNGKASPTGPTATRERVITHTSPGETPNLTIRILFSDVWTDEGVNEITDRVTLAARHGYTAVPEAEAAQPAGEARVVAYRAPGSGHLYCRTCCGGPSMYAGLTSDDLPDGGLCDECGVDVLIFDDASTPLVGEAAHTVPVTTADPLIVRWDRLVMHPNDPDDNDTIVCCLTTEGQPVALVLDEELRQALGGSLLDPDGTDDHGSMADVFTASELHEMGQDAEYRMDAADEARDAERGDDV